MSARAAAVGRWPVDPLVPGVEVAAHAQRLLVHLLLSGLRVGSDVPGTPVVVRGSPAVSAHGIPRTVLGGSAVGVAAPFRGRGRHAGLALGLDEVAEPKLPFLDSELTDELDVEHRAVDGFASGARVAEDPRRHRRGDLDGRVVAVLRRLGEPRTATIRGDPAAHVPATVVAGEAARGSAIPLVEAFLEDPVRARARDLSLSVVDEGVGEEHGHNGHEEETSHGVEPSFAGDRDGPHLHKYYATYTKLSRSQGVRMELFSPGFVVWNRSCNESPKSLRVIVFLQVTELMRNEVLDEL